MEHDMINVKSSRKKILISDDDKTSLAVLSSVINKLGLEPICAQNSQDTIKFLDDSIELVLLDIMMPVVDGISLLRQVRSNPSLHDIPVIMVTALSDRKTRLDAVEAGANDFITKPFDTVELMTRITSHLKYKLLHNQILQYKQQMLFRSRMESVGQLSAGLAHEINNPIQYISNSLSFLEESFKDMIQIISLYERLVNNLEKKQNNYEELVSSIGCLVDNLDIPFIRKEAPRTFEAIGQGLFHITKIVSSMSRLSSNDRNKQTKLDVNLAIENSLIVMKSEWTAFVDVTTNFDQELPLVQCSPALISHAVLNILINAAEAVKNKKNLTKIRGKISITTQTNGDNILVSIKDSGVGISRLIGDKVYDLFFTTKEVGKGIGQGLTFAYDVIVNKHKGNIFYESDSDEGTTFYISIPINSPIQ